VITHEVHKWERGVSDRDVSDSHGLAQMMVSKAVPQSWERTTCWASPEQVSGLMLVLFAHPYAHVVQQRALDGPWVGYVSEADNGHQEQSCFAVGDGTDAAGFVERETFEFQEHIYQENLECQL
jgi:hypothetical protein